MDPFIYNAPVRRADFYNREEVMHKVINQLLGKAQGDVWLVGERQIGKTSLLQHFESNSDEYVKSFLHYGIEKELFPVFIYVNVQGVSRVDDFYGILHYGLKSKFDMKQRLEKNTYGNFINSLISKFNDGFYPVFLIDEFDSMLESIAQVDERNFTNFIKKFNATLEGIQEISLKPKAFSCAYAANCTMNELLNDLVLKETIGSGLKSETVELEWFTEKQVEELAGSYLQNSDIKFTDKEIKLCYKYSQGYPYFTQKLLSIMYDNKPMFTKEKGFEKMIKEEFGKEFEKTIKTWGAQKMPPRTAEKLKYLAGKAGDKLFDIGLKILVAYTKG